MSTLRKVLAQIAVVFVLAAIFTGCTCVVYSTHSNTAKPSPVYTKSAPPPPQAEVRPASPGGSYVWIQGHWEWNASSESWSWSDGVWEEPPEEDVAWTEPEYTENNGDHVYVAGHWTKKRPSVDVDDGGQGAKPSIPSKDLQESTPAEGDRAQSLKIESGKGAKPGSVEASAKPAEGSAQGDLVAVPGPSSGAKPGKVSGPEPTGAQPVQIAPPEPSGHEAQAGGVAGPGTGASKPHGNKPKPEADKPHGDKPKPEADKPHGDKPKPEGDKLEVGEDKDDKVKPGKKPKDKKADKDLKVGDKEVNPDVKNAGKGQLAH